MGDQDHDCFFSNIMSKSLGNQIQIVFDEATPSKEMPPTIKKPSNIIEKESY